jgi:phosphonopyruvate decarboxylase
MIRAEALLAALVARGSPLVAGVPCSYLTPLIDAAIDSTSLRYVGAANEGDAVAIACGAYLGTGRPGVAMFQNSGLGNAVNPLTSLTPCFELPLLLITTWRGEPGAAPDEPQHERMGEITPRLLELMGLPWERMPEREDDLAPALARAEAAMSERRGPVAWIAGRHALAGGARAGHGARPARSAVPASAPPRQRTAPLDPDDALRAVQSAVGPRDVVCATTGYTGRALYALGDLPNQLYMVGSMGCVSSLALGLALVRPERRVIALDGDGAVLMRMGALATLAHEAPPNLVHVLLDNGVHESTGAQATVSHSADLAAIAAACGYAQVLRAEKASDLRDAIADAAPGLRFVHVRTSLRANPKLPRPTITPPEVAARLMRWLEVSR